MLASSYIKPEICEIWCGFPTDHRYLNDPNMAFIEHEFYPVLSYKCGTRYVSGDHRSAKVRRMGIDKPFSENWKENKGRQYPERFKDFSCDEEVTALKKRIKDLESELESLKSQKG